MLVAVQIYGRRPDAHHLGTRELGRGSLRLRPAPRPCPPLTISVPYTGDVILISQKCWPSPSSLVPRTAAVPQLYSTWKLTLRSSQLSRVAEDLFPASHTQSKSVGAEEVAGWAQALEQGPTPYHSHPHLWCPGTHAHRLPRSDNLCSGRRCAGYCRRQPGSGPRTHRKTRPSQAPRWGWQVAGLCTQVPSQGRCAGGEA